jgi:hypothetical protein
MEKELLPPGYILGVQQIIRICKEYESQALVLDNDRDSPENAPPQYD